MQLCMPCYCCQGTLLAYIQHIVHYNSWVLSKRVALQLASPQPAAKRLVHPSCRIWHYMTITLRLLERFQLLSKFIILIFEVEFQSEHKTHHDGDNLVRLAAGLFGAYWSTKLQLCKTSCNSARNRILHLPPLKN